MGYGPITLPLRHGEREEPEGFEPTRENRNALAGHPVNHSGKAPLLALPGNRTQNLSHPKGESCH